MILDRPMHVFALARMIPIHCLINFIVCPHPFHSAQGHVSRRFDDCWFRLMIHWFWFRSRGVHMGIVVFSNVSSFIVQRIERLIWYVNFGHVVINFLV